MPLSKTLNLCLVLDLSGMTENRPDITVNLLTGTLSISSCTRLEWYPDPRHAYE